MGYYKRRYRNNYYRSYGNYRFYSKQTNWNLGLVITIFIMIVFMLIANKFNMSFNKILIVSIVILIGYIMYKFLKKIKNYFDMKKIKKSDLYKMINMLNTEYSFDKFEPFYDSYYVRNREFLNNSDIDEFLMKTIETKYDKLVEYKKKYDEIKTRYGEYNQKYDNLIELITMEEAKKLRMNFKKYEKYQKKIYTENRINIDDRFQVIIYLNYSSRKGKVKDNRYKIYDEKTFIKVLDEQRNKKEIDKLSNVERAIMTDSMRYDVFKRDGFRCQICGATQKDGVQLHVDHIIPVSKGGKTKMENLQTLCSRCNIGKSNKM